MPIYEFTCRKCRHDFEEIVFSATEKIQCPACGAGRVERRMSVFAHHSSGSDNGGRGSSSSGGGSSCSGCSSGNCSTCG